MGCALVVNTIEGLCDRGECIWEKEYSGVSHCHSLEEIESTDSLVTGKVERWKAGTQTN